MCMRLAAIVVSELMLDKAVHDKFASGLVKKKKMAALLLYPITFRTAELPGCVF